MMTMLRLGVGSLSIVGWARGLWGGRALVRMDLLFDSGVRSDSGG